MSFENYMVSLRKQYPKLDLNKDFDEIRDFYYREMAEYDGYAEMYGNPSDLVYIYHFPNEGQNWDYTYFRVRDDYEVNRWPMLSVAYGTDTDYTSMILQFSDERGKNISELELWSYKYRGEWEFNKTNLANITNLDLQMENFFVMENNKIVLGSEKKCMQVMKRYYDLLVFS